MKRWNSVRSILSFMNEGEQGLYLEWNSAMSHRLPNEESGIAMDPNFCNRWFISLLPLILCIHKGRQIRNVWITNPRPTPKARWCPAVSAVEEWNDPL
jgi:hypothetical protein